MDPQTKRTSNTETMDLVQTFTSHQATECTTPTRPQHSPQARIGSPPSSQYKNRGTPSNIGKRRTYGASLLSSPARHGHSVRMADIFHAAATTPDIPKANILATSSKCGTQRSRAFLGTKIVLDSDIRYPQLPCLPEQPFICYENEVIPTPTNLDGASRLSGHRIPAEHVKLRLSSPLAKRHYQSPAPHQSIGIPQSAETIKPRMQYQALGRPGQHSVERVDGAVSVYSYTSSNTASSASWTGDSQFYFPKPRPPNSTRRQASGEQRQCSVSEWLESLPLKLDDVQEPDEEPLSPLSSGVEVERGSTRQRRIERKIRQRCVSYDDDDIFLG